MVSRETGRERWGGGGRRRGGEEGGGVWPTGLEQLPINAALLLGPAIEISETTATIEIIFSSAAANIGTGSAPGKIQERHLACNTATEDNTQFLARMILTTGPTHTSV